MGGGKRHAGEGRGGTRVSWNLASVFESVCDTFPDRVAITQADRLRSWSAFDERAARFAGALRELGLRPDAKVAAYLYNSNEFLEAMYGTLKARCVWVNVNYRYEARELEYLLDDSDTEVLVFHGSLADRVAAVRDRLPELRAVVEVREGDGPLLEGAIDYEDLLGAHDPMERIERSGDDLWFLYTGGTTGMPKGVMWRNEDLYGALGEAAYRVVGGALPESSAGAGPVAGHPCTCRPRRSCTAPG
jgi:3-oxocholest-4-en-26-oate---CoA ligase